MGINTNDPRYWPVRCLVARDIANDLRARAADCICIASVRTTSSRIGKTLRDRAEIFNQIAAAIESVNRQ